MGWGGVARVTLALVCIMLAEASIMGGMTKNPLGDIGNGLGDYLREQRESARLSVRQLSELAGVSNPYLSQIERGLKKPSADILQQIAKGLQVSAESLYIRAGLLDPDDDTPPGRPTVVEAVKHDANLTSRQKSALLDIYESFVTGSTTSVASPEVTVTPVPEADAEPATPTKRAARSSRSRTTRADGSASGTSAASRSRAPRSRAATSSTPGTDASAATPGTPAAKKSAGKTAKTTKTTKTTQAKRTTRRTTPREGAS